MKRRASASKGRCPACSHVEDYTIDRLLVLGHGSRFIAARFGITRQQVRCHQRECLPDRRPAVEAKLREMAGASLESGEGA